MQVLKFGGTSVGSVERIKEVGNLIHNNTQKVVVLSAMSGTTNSLVEIANCLYQKDNAKAKELTDRLEQKYLAVVQSLYNTETFLMKGKEMISSHFEYIRSFTKDVFTLFEEKAVLAQGELLSTALFHFYLCEQGIDAALMPALNFMRTTKDGEPDMDYIETHLQKELSQHQGVSIYITQGYICRNAYGEIDNLKRGGSDYSASLIGAALNAQEIQIWTDIDGMHNNDPRFVDNTQPLSHLSFDEAAELAYFGAKILHPASVQPAKNAAIPVRLKNTMNPEAEGTLISGKAEGYGIKAIAAKDDITAIKIKSGRMLLAHGFMRKIFEIFETYQTSIDMITTSEVAVSVTIDDTTHLDAIVNDLQKYGTVNVDQNLSIICVVGHYEDNSKGYALKIFSAFSEIPVRMISYGGSKHNVSILVDTQNKKEALSSLHQKLF